MRLRRYACTTQSNIKCPPARWLSWCRERATLTAGQPREVRSKWGEKKKAGSVCIVMSRAGCQAYDTSYVGSSVHISSNPSSVRASEFCWEHVGKFLGGAAGGFLQVRAPDMPGFMLTPI